MKGSQTDVEIDTNISYSLNNDSFNKPLRLHNHSDHTYVFKIKTNQKTVISLQTTHDFILPHSIRQIAIRLADKPSTTSQLKLQFNYALAHAEDIQNKDSKMVGYGKEEVFRLVVSVNRHQGGPQVQMRPEIGQLGSGIMGTPLKVEEKREQKQGKIEDMETIKQEIQFGSAHTPSKVQSPQPQTNKFTVTSPEMTARSSQPVQFKKVQSQEIKVELKAYDPDATQSIYLPAHEDPLPSKPASVLSANPSQKIEEERALREIEQKLTKERSTIRNLQYSTSSNSVYPFPILLLCLMGAFLMGSLMKHIVA